jgi:hypothetical protein
VDDYGNKWNCVLIYGYFSYKHFKIGGEWKWLVAARRLEVDDHIKVGGYVREKNENLYLIICHWLFRFIIMHFVLILFFLVCLQLTKYCTNCFKIFPKIETVSRFNICKFLPIS